MFNLHRFYFLLLLFCTHFIVEAKPLVKNPALGSQKHVITGINLAAAQVSKQQAAKIARQHVAGRVLKISLHKNTYRVKIVSQSGDVVSVLVNATTGQIIKR